MTPSFPSAAMGPRGLPLTATGDGAPGLLRAIDGDVARQPAGALPSPSHAQRPIDGARSSPARGQGAYAALRDAPARAAGEAAAGKFLTRFGKDGPSLCSNAQRGPGGPAQPSEGALAPSKTPAQHPPDGAEFRKKSGGGPKPYPASSTRKAPPARPRHLDPGRRHLTARRGHGHQEGPTGSLVTGIEDRTSCRKEGGGWTGRGLGAASGFAEI